MSNSVADEASLVSLETTTVILKSTISSPSKDTTTTVNVKLCSPDASSNSIISGVGGTTSTSPINASPIASSSTSSTPINTSSTFESSGESPADYLEIQRRITEIRQKTERMKLQRKALQVAPSTTSSVVGVIPITVPTNAQPNDSARSPLPSIQKSLTSLMESLTSPELLPSETSVAPFDAPQSNPPMAKSPPRESEQKSTKKEIEVAPTSSKVAKSSGSPKTKPATSASHGKAAIPIPLVPNPSAYIMKSMVSAPMATLALPTLTPVLSPDSVPLMSEKVDAKELIRLRQQNISLQQTLAEKSKELATAKKDLEVLGEKLIDEIERRAEILHAKDAVQEELEDLTQTLFEEANKMVATEARSRHHHETKEVALTQQLAEVKSNYDVEHAQLTELREKMAEIQREYDALVLSAQAHRIVYEPDSNLIDEILFGEFEEFVRMSPDVPLSKIHSVLYMKNALEDDVSPCLKFPLSMLPAKKLVTSILNNTCFVQEIPLSKRLSVAQMTASSEHLSGSAIGLNSASSTAENSPITSTNSSPALTRRYPPKEKTMYERISWMVGSTSTSKAQQPSDSEPSAIMPPEFYCSLCGIGSLQLSCPYRFKISDLDAEQWSPICQMCRNRLVMTCEFYNFIRHLRQGLYASRSLEDLFLNLIELKKKMFYARIGSSVKEIESGMPSSRGSLSSLPSQGGI